ncbi:MAG TPA: cache domain-containing protein, partial [Methylotenera sp.]|nr:cache domain-containing protein [Methylotenera sp.]
MSLNLKSNLMQLSRSERHWLPWFGSTGKLKMAWSCYLNQDIYADVEHTFEAIAATRVKLLEQWSERLWQEMNQLAQTIAEKYPDVDDSLLKDALQSQGDFSELFVVTPQGDVTHSTFNAHLGRKVSSSRSCEKALSAGLQDSFLHGPYIDKLTLEIGPSSSKFHDAVTLMFFQPIIVNGESVAVLCGRVPNDVMSDLIQREAGHIYPESGDNYIFMVDSRFDPSLQQGIALSRSRFEDNAFSHGENLKSGIHTHFGVVKVNQHTEFEIRFTDPATGQLHPGVRETIKNGQNLFVTYPGYSDYRHIPVIGKGITFQIKGSPDRWGMMCEGDLEEVYRRRSVNVMLIKGFVTGMAGLLGVNSALHYFSDLPQLAIGGISIGVLVVIALWLRKSLTQKLANRLNQMTRVIQEIAEGEGN